jgi:hypothetical protein
VETVNEHYEPLTKVNDSHFEVLRQLRGLPADAKEIPQPKKRLRLLRMAVSSRSKSAK